MIAAHKLVKVTDMNKWSAQRNNQKLQMMGLQFKRWRRTKDDKGRKSTTWVPTAEGRKWCKEFQYKVTSHCNGVATLHWGFYLRWHPEVFDRAVQNRT